MRKHVLGGILLGAIVALAGVAARADDAIKFGVAAEPYPPFSSKDSSGKWVGFEIDLMDAVCAHMQAKCQLVETADEIFSTGNASKVLPVTRIGDRSLQPGPFYRKARELYWEFAHS